MIDAMTREAAHRALSTAISEGRFEAVACLATEYKRSVERHLASTDPKNGPPTLAEILKPLYAARDLLIIIRAHQATQFQKLAIDGLYRFSAAPRKGRTLDVDA